MSLNILNQSEVSSLKFLDWHSIIDELSGFAYFDLTKEIFQKPPSHRSRDVIEHNYDAVDYILTNLTEYSRSFDRAVRNLSSDAQKFNAIHLLEKCRECSISELNFLCNIFEAVIILYKPNQEVPLARNFPFNDDNIKSIEKGFANRLRKFVTPDGQVDFFKHPKLSKIYNEMIGIERQLRDDIKRTSKSSLYKNALQFDEHDIIHEYFVLAIKSDSYQYDHGPIISKSSSGMTLYVSPPQSMKKNNRRLRLAAELEEETAKICLEFSTFLSKFYNDFLLFSDFLIYFDSIKAKAIYCEKNDLKRPVFSDNKELKIEDFYHPMIQDPIKNEISIPEDKYGVIISGPNTGGKTVALKALTLCHLFPHLGLFIPARYSQIFPYKKIYYFSHDQQDLKKGLSSFASEVKNYLNLLSEIENGEDSLIIIDEIFNSTSSEEASALAISLLEEIQNRSKSKIIISTHHQMLKTLIFDKESYISAHVGYDIENDLPTYKVHYGNPGSSMAFEIFEHLSKRFGLESNIANSAKEILDSKSVSFEHLLAEVTKKSSELDYLLRDNKIVKFELEKRAKSNEGTIKLEKDRILKEFKQSLEEIQEEGEQFLKEIKETKDISSKVFGNKIKGIKNKLPEPQIQSTESKSPYLYNPVPDIDEIILGKIYYSEVVKDKVTVTAVNKRKRTISIKNRNIGIWAPADSIRELGKIKDPKAKLKPEVFINIEREIIGKLEIDCRGMRLDEFQNSVEKSLIEVENGDIPYIVIVHGHGTGILKKLA